MKAKKNIPVTVEETGFEIALRASGYDLGINDVKIAYRLAMLIHEKKGDATLREVIKIKYDVIQESMEKEEAK